MKAIRNYDRYVEKMQQIADLSNVLSLLHWDQEVYMPADGISIRSGQLSMLSGMIHDLQTSPGLVELLRELASESGLSADEHKNVEVTLRDTTRKLLLDRDFVERLTYTTSNAFVAWDKARKESDFSIFAPWLEKIIALKQEECRKIGYQDHPYDVLLDEFEPGMKTRTLDTLFAAFKPELEELLKQISATGPDTHEDSFMYLNYPKDKQWQAGLDVLGKMGFDFNRGRQDISTHPFTISVGAKDIRITTRINENNLHEMLWSCIHEGGHALYEQGFDEATYGLPQSEAASLGIHESQSRLWENHIGRGASFWDYYFPKLQQRFPQQLSTVTSELFYAAINKVRPSLIRTNADELTYHFHVIIRFEIEKELIEGSLKATDLPTRWNELYKKYLGLDVPDDSSGVLQDIHWSHGSFGYFPTYSLGSLYAAQFYHQATLEISNLEKEISEGNLIILKNWLRKKIHRIGKLADSDDLCRKITGESLNFRYFIDYASRKYRSIYRFSELTVSS